MTDDAGDLFDSDESEESVDWDELSPVEDDAEPPADSATDEPAGSIREATGAPADDFGAFEPPESGSPEEAPDDPWDSLEAFESSPSETAAADGSATSGSTSTESTPTHDGGVTEEPSGESGPGGAPVESGVPAGPARAGSEPDDSTEITTGRNADEHEPPEPERRDDSGSTGPGTTTAGGSTASNRLTTGIDELDRAMGGGVPPGRLVLLVSDPGVQSELIVDSLLAQRDTLFVTTDRPDWEVTKDIEPGVGSGEVVIRDHTPDSLLSGVDTLLDELEPSSNFVLDSVNELELVPRQRYLRLLSDVKRRLFDTGSVGLLTGVTVGHDSARDLTLRRADVVWRLETRTVNGEIENRLSVPKFRGGAALTETVRLELTDEVRVVGGRQDE